MLNNWWARHLSVIMQHKSAPHFAAKAGCPVEFRLCESKLFEFKYQNSASIAVVCKNSSYVFICLKKEIWWKNKIIYCTTILFYMLYIFISVYFEVKKNKWIDIERNYWINLMEIKVLKTVIFALITCIFRSSI